MKWLKAAIGLLVVGGFVYGAVQYRSGNLDVPLLPPPPKAVELPAGTEVPLVLVTPVDSAGSKEGEPVRWLVARDVKVDGIVVVAKGTEVEGKVEQSRGGSVAGTLTNRPARLLVALGTVRAVDGAEIPLEGTAPGQHEFTKGNTRREPGHLIESLEDPDARRYAEGLFGRMAKGEKLSDEERKEADALLGKLAERYGMKNSRELARGKSAAGAVEKLLQGNAAALSAGELGLALAAIGEIADLLGGADRAVRRMLTGSNISAPFGLELVAKTAEARTVHAHPKKPGP